MIYAAVKLPSPGQVNCGHRPVAVLLPRGKVNGGQRERKTAQGASPHPPGPLMTSPLYRKTTSCPQETSSQSPTVYDGWPGGLGREPPLMNRESPGQQTDRWPPPRRPAWFGPRTRHFRLRDDADDERIWTVILGPGKHCHPDLHPQGPLLLRYPSGRCTSSLHSPGTEGWGLLGRDARATKHPA